MIKNTKELKQHNKYIILNEIVERQPISRKDLSQALDVSHATVSYIIKELISDGLVVETDYQESTGGRPPRLVEFRGDKKFVIAVEMSYTYISYAIYDLNFNIRREEKWDINDLKARDIIRNLYEKIFCEFFKVEGIDNNDIIGIGISVPGIYNYQDDILTDSISEIWQSVNFKEEFDKHFALPLYIENDANISTYYESAYGVGVDYSNLLYVFIAEGIGSGLIINGELYKGAHGLAGEISHIKSSEKDYPCTCGGKGCLEVVASMSAIKNEVIRELEQGIDSQLQDLLLDNIYINDIIKAYRQGDQLCQRVIKQSVDYLLSTVSGLINFLDPDLIIVGDIYNLYDKKMIDKMNKKLNSLSSIGGHSTKVVRRTEEDYIQLKATAKYVFDKWKHKI